MEQRGSERNKRNEKDQVEMKKIWKNEVEWNKVKGIINERNEG